MAKPAAWTDKTIMKVTVMAAALLVTFAPCASAQSTPSTVPLAEVARKEEQRQKQTKKPSKVFTNKDLKPDTGRPNTAASSTPAAGDAAPADPDVPAKEDLAPAKNQAYWQSRMKAALDEVTRLQLFAEALQSRINALTTDYVNRDDPAQRDKLGADRQAAVAELERVRKETEAKRKEITAIEDEARRAGVPPGWLRPSM
jgi:hypothetical protein